VTSLRGRASGILLHPTSLPGPYGIGELGSAAYAFLDYLAAAGQSLWQVLPLGPTGYGDSPYACFSSFAGNPLLVSLDALVDLGVLERRVMADAQAGAQRFAENRVDFGALIEWKMPLLRQAAARFLDSATNEQRVSLESFIARESWWLEDYALFMAIKGKPGPQRGAWNDSWPLEIALRSPTAMARLKIELERQVKEEQVIQFFFFMQWDALHAAATRKGIRVVGDLPIFAAPDSADIWANRELFLLDRDGKPTVVSGVPPDYFAATGQLWGNPLYDWDEMARQGFRFWIQRIRSACRMFDIVRIDHFRGFEACWSVRAGERTAERGEWVKVPGVRMFEEMEKELGSLPLIAEDLGVITPEVNALRERFGFPGMRILQFAFDRGESGRLASDNRFLPHNHAPDSVVYTGTHDNDTTRGWWAARRQEERDYLERYCGATDPEIEWRLIRMAMSSVCRASVIPFQDVLGLGSQTRMNTPGTSSGENWTWRTGEGCFSAATAERLRSLAETYGRLPVK
jgi:4-alpha-glucanotransferase